MANDRISQLPIETVLAPTSGKGRVSQQAVETVLAPTNAKGRNTQMVIEAVVYQLPRIHVTIREI
jgi:hypothetical protein